MIDTLTTDDHIRLLGRPVEPLLTNHDREAFAGHVCLITGAGGSVGSELARQIAACNPARLVLLDHSEHALFRVEHALVEESPGTIVEPVLCDVTRKTSVAHVIRRVRPDIVFHAAAYKHVTMAERAICAAARVNVLGTNAVLTAAREIGARFVLISSDKAAAPHSVMGATKRLAEVATLSAEDRTSWPIVVRFGNVLGSSGSVLEVMSERIRSGRPILVTDPSATRFFMTVTEAASLVMKATRMARGGETFWLDMGEQVRIGDLADRLLQIAAERGFPSVPVDIVGLRPGEKKIEQLASQGISLDRTIHPRIWVARQAPVAGSLCEDWLVALRRFIARDDARGVLNVLTASVRDFVPSAHAWEMARASEAPAPMVTRTPHRRSERWRPAPEAPAAPPFRSIASAGKRGNVVPMPRRADFLR